MDAFAQVGLVLAHISVALPSSQRFHDGIKTITVTQTPHSVDPVHTLQKGINNTGPLPRIEDRSRYRNDRYSGGRRDFKFDKSPRGRKPRVASKTPDQDRDRCHNCHEFGHFARECPYAEESASNHDTTSRDTRAMREKHVPGRKQRNNNASFQFSNQDHQTASEADEFDDPEMDYMMPFFDDEVLNI